MKTRFNNLHRIRVRCLGKSTREDCEIEKKNIYKPVCTFKCHSFELFLLTTSHMLETSKGVC